MHVELGNCRLGPPSGKQRSGSRKMVGRAGDGPSSVPEEGGGTAGSGSSRKRGFVFYSMNSI